MTKTLSVSPNERGLIRLFALSMSDEDAKLLRDGPPFDPDDIIGDVVPEESALFQQRKLLGAAKLDEDFTEVFKVADLDELGLAGYMIEGNGVLREQIEPDRTKLAALDGWVMVVYSAAFEGQAMTLDPAPELTLIATYEEPGVDWTSDVALTAKSASKPAVKQKPSDAAMMGRVATIALLVMFALTGLVIWIAG